MKKDWETSMISQLNVSETEAKGGKGKKESFREDRKNARTS